MKYKPCIELKKSNCKNCYKCIRQCPVKSIRFSANQAHIVENECIYCGQCVSICTQKAKNVRNDLESLSVLLAEDAPVYVSLAPSFAANYPGTTIETMNEALMKLGFAGAEETASGAAAVTKAYEGLIEEGKQDVIISTCCHSVNLLVRRYYPEALSMLARIVSPMTAHCRALKKKYPGCRTVFVGPCVSKKHEQSEFSEDVDCVLTFPELTELFKKNNISPKTGTNGNMYSKSRLFPVCGGILETMHIPEDSEYTYLAVSGAVNCRKAIEDVLSGRISKCFIEMSVCEGSCICGPAMDGDKISPISGNIAVRRYAGKFDMTCPDLEIDEIRCDHKYDAFPKAEPSEEDIKKVLKMMGKHTVLDQLNCGCCGYSTCREKAVAVIHGKAEIGMCLPFLKDKAESFSDNILNHSRIGIIVLNDNLEVQQINSSALELFNLRDASAILGEKADRILDIDVFKEVKSTFKDVIDRRVYLPDYMKHVEESVLYDSNYHVFLCMLRDITDIQSASERKEKSLRRTAEVADQVVEKQMRVVQEIASLLGETAAETKIALTKLKESLTDESALY